MVKQTCNSSPSEAETGGLLKIWGHPELGSEEYQASKVADIETRYWDTFWNKTKNWNTSDDVQRKDFLCNIDRNASEYSIIEDSMGFLQQLKMMYHMIQQYHFQVCVCAWKPIIPQKAYSCLLRYYS